MAREKSSKSSGDKQRPSMTAGIAADLRDAAREVGEAIRSVQEATSQLPGLGALIGEVVRTVTDVDTIKALADPTRLAILRTLMDGDGSGPRVMSAKELAEELNEPQTKLYRHLKVLEAQHLIEVAETRLVSGIVETRYRAAQTDLHFDASAMDLREADEDVLRVVGIGIDEFRDRFLAASRRGGFPFSPDTPEDRRFGGVANVGVRMSADRAREFHTRLNALVKELEGTPRDPDGVYVDVLLAWYAPPRSRAAETEAPAGSAS